MYSKEEQNMSPSVLSNTKPQTKQERAIGLARLAGSAKLGEKKVDLVEIMREVKGK